MNCASCKNELGEHYRLSRVSRDGTVGGNVVVCSLLCLTKWAYVHGAQRAAVGVMMAKHTIGGIVSALRGPKP